MLLYVLYGVQIDPVKFGVGTCRVVAISDVVGDPETFPVTLAVWQPKNVNVVFIIAGKTAEGIDEFTSKNFLDEKIPLP